MTKSDLIELVASKLHLPKGKAELIVNCIFDSMVDALQHRIRVKNSTTAGTCTNRKYPAWFCHLQVNLSQHGPHFLRNCTHYHEQIALTWRKTHPFSPKSCQIVMTGSSSHKFYSAA